MPLTDDAKNEIKEAIRIVREDRFEKFAREKLTTRQETPKVEKQDELLTPETDTPTPPPAKPKEELPKEEPPKRKSAYWGEILTD